MREILFRGIWVHGNKEWIEGDLVRDSEGKPHIVDNKYAVYWGGESTFVCEDECEVIPETVGQYTGLTDKNGKKIFEGDIVIKTRKIHIRDLEFIDGIPEKGVVGFKFGCFALLDNYKDDKSSGTLFISSKYESYEVIGNIHDNKELLEVK